MKFEIKNFENGGIYLDDENFMGLILLGDILIKRKVFDYQTTFVSEITSFDYHGNQKLLFGKGIFGSFIPERIFVIQMIERNELINK